MPGFRAAKVAKSVGAAKAKTASPVHAIVAKSGKPHGKGGQFAVGGGHVAGGPKTIAPAKNHTPYTPGQFAAKHGISEGSAWHHLDTAHQSGHITHHHPSNTYLIPHGTKVAHHEITDPKQRKVNQAVVDSRRKLDGIKTELSAARRSHTEAQKSDRHKLSGDIRAARSSIKDREDRQTFAKHAKLLKTHREGKGSITADHAEVIRGRFAAHNKPTIKAATPREHTEALASRFPGHTIRSADVTKFTAGSPYKETLIHRTFSESAAHSISNDGINISANKVGAFGGGFYTANYAEEGYGNHEVRLAIHPKNPLRGSQADILKEFNRFRQDHPIKTIVAGITGKGASHAFREHLISRGHDAIVMDVQDKGAQDKHAAPQWVVVLDAKVARVIQD